jgi:ketosteroid isomerase-like protein
MGRERMATDQDRRERNKAVLRHFFTHMAEIIEGGVDEVKKWRTEESLTWIPFGGSGEPMVANDHGWAGMQTVPVTFKFWRHEIVNIFECLDPDVLWVEADAVSRTRLLDLDYHQRYVCCFTFKDGKLAGNKEYFNGDQVRLLLQEHEHRARAEAG